MDQRVFHVQVMQMRWCFERDPEGGRSSLAVTGGPVAFSSASFSQMKEGCGIYLLSDIVLRLRLCMAYSLLFVKVTLKEKAEIKPS